MRAPTVVLILAAVFAAGCATLTVSSHIERNVTFTDFVTYDWGPPDNLPVGDPRLDNNPFFVDYLQGAIEKMLAAKGYEIDRRRVMLKEPIKEPGEFEAPIKLHRDVTSHVKVVVRSEEEAK